MDIIYIEDTLLTLYLEIKNSENIPIDITGGTIYFTVKEELNDVPDDSGSVISIDVTSHTDPTNGITQIDIPATPFNAIDCIYDIMYSDASADNTQLVNGFFKFKRAVTNRA